LTSKSQPFAGKAVWRVKVEDSVFFVRRAGVPFKNVESHVREALSVPPHLEVQVFPVPTLAFEHEIVPT
jgi:hypothetical protein